VNWIDLLIVVALVLGLFTGYRRGVVVQVFSWGGFLLGLVVGALLAPGIVSAFDPKSPTTQAIITVAAFLGVAFALEGLIAFAGFKLSRKISHGTVRRVDAIVGSGVAAMLSLAMSWFVSAPARQVPELEESVRGSAILDAIDATLGTPPDFFGVIGGLLDRTGFPQVFSRLNPGLAPGVERPPARLRRDPEIRFAARLTYKIESDGCGGRVDGSGFPVDRTTVVTAAHVVAGTSDTKVIQATDAGGDVFDATVVYMDTDTDIAILRTAPLDDGTLRIASTSAERGTDGAAIGYPGGGDRVTSPARVRAQTEAIGRDIYSRRQVQREIYVLRSIVRQGNSGGPFVDDDGIVRGMIFAASASQEEESYALAEVEIERAIANAAGRRRGVDTGRCAI